MLIGVACASAGRPTGWVLRDEAHGSAHLELQEHGAQDSKVVISVERLEARACDVREAGVRRRLRQLSQQKREIRPAEQHGQLLARGGPPSRRGTACCGDGDDQINKCSSGVDFMQSQGFAAASRCFGWGSLSDQRDRFQVLQAV